MRYAITSLASIPDEREPLETMLHDYMSLMLDKLAALGGPELTSKNVLHGLWDDFDAYLPPHGRVLLAHDETGALIGCGFMRQVRPDAGEMKRLFVRPQARGTGLGRQLVVERMDVARQLGWKTLLVDTVRGNTAMLKLYGTLGFKEIERYAENANDKALAPYLTYLACDLTA